MAAMPLDGWQPDLISVWLFRSVGWCGAFLFTALITALSLSRKHSRDLAFHDHLTKLPNRRLLEDRISQVMSYSVRYQTSFGIFNLDLDKFKYINDKFGHKVGDGLLVVVAKRLLASVRATDTVARVGGDEFIILVNDIHNEFDMEKIRQKIEKNLISATYVNGIDLDLNVSMGFAVYPEDTDSIEKLHSIADERMYATKKTKGR